MSERWPHLCQESEIIFSICPPESASNVASTVRHGRVHRDTFVDCNAISPRTHASRLPVSFQRRRGFPSSTAGSSDIRPGSPARRGFISQAAAAEPGQPNAATAGPLHCEVVGPDIGQASALKMCYAALSKGTTAMLCAILATADELGVRNELCRHWDRDECGTG